MPIYKGQTKIVKLYKGSTQIVKRYKGTNLIYSASRLPVEFQEVEYLESTGNQYIDSQLLNKNTYNFKAKFSITDLSGASAILGATQSLAPTYYSTYLAKQSSGALRTCCGSWGNVLEYQNALVDTIYKVKYENNNYIKTLFVNDNQIATTTDNSTFSSTTHIYIFARIWESGIIDGKAKAKLYSLQIYDDSTLVRDFIPCYRKADNVAGLYDLVNGVFYTNAGTGTFIVGGNV